MEAHHLFFIAGGILLIATPALIFSVARIEAAKPPARHRLEEILSGDAVSPYDDEQRLQPRRRLFGIRGHTWRQIKEDSEHLASIAHRLRLAGVISARNQMAAIIGAVSFSLMAALGTGLALVMNDQTTGKAALYGVLVAIGLLMFLFSTLDRAAISRQQEIEDETLMLIQTTRMLWRVGLSLPKTLSILCDELRHLTPQCARELRIVFQRIDAGQSQDEALYQLAHHTSSDGFKEFLVILRQESLSGGGIDKALTELYNIMQSRRKTGLQEKVSKTSAKMSVVMMMLLFPALLIIIGGPGYIAVSKALAQLAGGMQ